MKKLLICVEAKNNTWSNKEQFEQNAVLFDEYMLKSFTDDVIPLLNSVSSEWVRVSDDYISDWVNRNNFNYWFKALGE